MRERILNFLSRFTKRKLHLGYGVSTDVGLRWCGPITPERMERVQREGKVIYELKDADVTGGFEFVDIIRKRDVPTYRVKHTQTGEIFDLTKSAFELFLQLKKEK